MPADNIQDIQEALTHFKQTIAELGKEEAVLKLSKRYSREDVSFLMDQLNGKETAAQKFPTIAEREGILYPPSYYLEQTSSEITARFKASLVQGQMLIDMTGGFGIDTYFFAEKMKSTWYIEQDPVIFEIASKNLQLLNADINAINANSVEFLQGLQQKADWLYLDPIRRTKEKRLLNVEEYSPNILEIRELLLDHGHNIMIKLSPMTDISQVVKSIGNHVSKVYVLATDNECKELLLIMDEQEHADVIIESVHWLKGTEERFTSTLKHKPQPPALSAPLEYLYEPNAAIFKAQQYDEQAIKYSLSKLHPNTHLYTSHNYHPSYAGKVYKIKNIYPFDAKAFKKENTSPAFNIKTRNFPSSPAEVAKRLGVMEGGNEFLFCVKDKDQKLIMILCIKP